MSSLAKVLLCSLTLINLAISVFAQDAALKPDDFVSKHLQAIGPAAARDAAKTRVVKGTAAYRILVGGSGREEGSIGFATDGHKLRLVLRVPGNYRGENVLFSGDVAQVAFSNSDQTRSPLGSFLVTNDVILQDGLLGGSLSTAWPLLDVTGRGAKLVYEGIKKVDGHPLYQLRYQPRKHSDMEILLYVEQETFRHVRTVYSLRVANNVGTTIVKSAGLQPERSQLEEQFSDFVTVDGLTLPTHWNLQFTRELPNGSTSLTEWDMKGLDIKNNVGLDPRNFAAK